ncbi:zinc finger protein 507 isoform X1 [Pelobates fuscus]|uniref:zinc finger protein 507 isoform X1 n=1 Tax=Pelobates fuscus TaxID=191477 RepID=UPI002FE4CFD7
MMENKESLAEIMPNIEDKPGRQVLHAVPSQTLASDEKLKLNYPLINMIQKLTAMVNSDKSDKCMEGKKRSYPADSTQSPEVSGACSVPPREGDPVPQISKKSKVSQDGSSSDLNEILQSNRKVINYQCNICKFTSSSFEVLKVHVLSHGQQNEIILMCSDCHLTFKSHDELEQHIKTHCEATSVAPPPLKDHAATDKQTSACSNIPEPGRKKWYAYEEYGLYRCLICRYTCGQQRMLKTHAWKHAGEVDCSYPIFEEENESASLPDFTVAHTPQESESVLSQEVEHEGTVQMLVCDSLQVQESLSLEGVIKEHKVVSQAPAPVTEVIVVEDTLLEADQENMIANSLLSSAHQIINCSPNKKGHVNVIVERLPGSEETTSQKTFLMNSEVVVKRKKILEESQVVSDAPPDLYHADKNAVENEEIVIGWSSTVKNGEFQATNENSPPVRRRTNSECLRLHSLAAEALVTMPIRIIECPKSNLRLFSDPSSIDPDTGQQECNANLVTCPKVDSSDVPKKCNGFSPNLIQEDDKVKNELTEEPIKTGISMSLLKVIEKLKERTDQNASDEDILKELQDNAQSESTSDVSTGNSLVEFLPTSERPYRCRLCHYTSDNKGYIKQHLRVHRQREPYQCPICEHIAENSDDLENHMINHCKTRTYECKHCAESFYYKNQLRTHELEHGSPPDVHSVSVSTEEPQGSNDDTEEKYSTEASKVNAPKLYKCDVCNYTSSTYVGVRNHRKIHTSDKPYRCSLCGYVCSHPPSLKSHMWKHASDQNYNYEQVNKAINEAMSQSSRAQGEPLKATLQEDTGVKEESDGGHTASLPANEGTGPTESSKVNIAQITICKTEELQSPTRPEPEICVLLFCCCICGFESTSKELLMEHMKAHEGEIINIILKKHDS